MGERETLSNGDDRVILCDRLKALASSSPDVFSATRALKQSSSPPMRSEELIAARTCRGTAVSRRRCFRSRRRPRPPPSCPINPDPSHSSTTPPPSRPPWDHSATFRYAANYCPRPNKLSSFLPATSLHSSTQLWKGKQQSRCVSWPSEGVSSVALPAQMKGSLGSMSQSSLRLQEAEVGSSSGGGSPRGLPRRYSPPSESPVSTFVATSAGGHLTHVRPVATTAPTSYSGTPILSTFGAPAPRAKPEYGELEAMSGDLV